MKFVIDSNINRQPIKPLHKLNTKDDNHLQICSELMYAVYEYKYIVRVVMCSNSITRCYCMSAYEVQLLIYVHTLFAVLHKLFRQKENIVWTRKKFKVFPSMVECLETFLSCFNKVNIKACVNQLHIYTRHLSELCH